MLKTADAAAAGEALHMNSSITSSSSTSLPISSSRSSSDRISVNSPPVGAARCRTCQSSRSWKSQASLSHHALRMIRLELPWRMSCVRVQGMGQRGQSPSLLHLHAMNILNLAIFMSKCRSSAAWSELSFAPSLQTLGRKEGGIAKAQSATGRGTAAKTLAEEETGGLCAAPMPGAQTSWAQQAPSLTITDWRPSRRTTGSPYALRLPRSRLCVASWGAHASSGQALACGRTARWGPRRGPPAQ